MTNDPRELLLRPIGTIRTPFQSRMEAPRQPRAAEGVPGRIELFPGHGYEDALADLEGWQYVWVIAWFDRNTSWRPKVMPPRSDRKRGVFSTRSPHRPNPIGLSVFELVAVEGLTVHVKDVDLLDGTPILDLKPYVPWTDAIPSARTGWLAPVEPLAKGERPEDTGPRYEVVFADEAERALDFLAAHGVDVRASIAYQLSIGPTPHAYRRIKRMDDGYVIGVRELRAHFTIEGEQVLVDRVKSGIKPGEARDEAEEALHRALDAGRFAPTDARDPGDAKDES